jgi:hypothetical protein
MSTQLTLPLDMPADVCPTRQVRVHGDSQVPYTYVPSHPGLDEEQLAALLELAESAIRYNQAPNPILQLDQRNGAGSNGPIGADGWILDGKGARNWELNVDVRWPAILALLRERQRVQPRTARARDLADAYRLLDYYQNAYIGKSGRGWVQTGDKWSPNPLLDRLREQIVELGGTVPRDLTKRR